jgi:DNA polymerase
MDALALLRLQMEWGADDALEEAPVDRLRPAAPPPAPLGRAPMPVAARLPGLLAAPSSVSAATLDELRAAIAGFDGCGLRTTATNLVFADGNPEAGLLVIGDAPAEEEDRSGRAFDGPAGAYLERMLASIGLDRRQALLTPLIPWRPPGARPPSASEIAACLPFLHRLIVLAAPRRALLLGTLAQRTILGAAPRRRPGSWLTAMVPGRTEPLPCLALASPTVLLTKPAGRRDAWADLRLLRRAIDAESAKK